MYVLDATQMSTGEHVTLKPITKGQPLDRGRLDVPVNPDKAILVLPTSRPLNDPPMEAVDEAVEFFRQVFEVLFSLFSEPRDDNLLNRVFSSSISHT